MVEVFSNISAPHNSPATGTVCVKILGKKFKGALDDGAS